MIELNIARLNLKSPYYVTQDEDGDLLFITDYGVRYAISFELNEGMMNYPAYEFGILNKENKTSPSDRKLRDTELVMKIEKTIGLPANNLLSAQAQYELEAAGADAQIADNKQETVTVTIPVRDRNLLQEIVKRFGWACVF